jgi:hypothetical protein
MAPALAIAVGLAACAANTASLSLTEIQALKLEAVEVVVPTDAPIIWGNAEREYAEKALAADPAAKKKTGETSEEQHDALINSAECKAYLRKKAADVLKRHVEQTVLPAYQGTRRAKLVVTLKDMTIPSALQRAFIGGVPVMIAWVSVVDATSGKTIASTPQDKPIIAAANAGNGIIGVIADQAFSDLDERLMASFANQTKGWLPNKA